MNIYNNPVLRNMMITIITWDGVSILRLVM